MISSCVGAVSTDVRRNLPGVWAEVTIEAQQVRSGETVAPNDALA